MYLKPVFQHLNLNIECGLSIKSNEECFNLVLTLTLLHVTAQEIALYLKNRVFGFSTYLHIKASIIAQLQYITQNKNVTSHWQIMLIYFSMKKYKSHWAVHIMLCTLVYPTSIYLSCTYCNRTWRKANINVQKAETLSIYFIQQKLLN